MASQLAELFGQLSLSNDKMTILSQIRTVMASASNDDLLSVVAQLPLTEILQNINADDSDQLESCCVILDRLFSAVDVNVLLTTFCSEVLLGLSLNSPSAVNDISLNQVARVANSSPQQLSLCVEVVQRVAHLIERETVSKKAVRILVAVGGSSEGLELIFHNQVLPHLLQVMSKDDATRFRVYEMIVDIAMLSVEAMLRCNESSLLQLLITELNKDDVVIQLNSLELLSKFSLTDHGFGYLEQTGAVRRIEELLVSSQDDYITSMLIVPGLFKFFGGLCYVRPKEMCSRFQMSFMKTTFAMTDPDAEAVDPGNADIAMETIGLIGSTPDGKMALAKHYDAMVLTCRSLGRLLTNASSNRRSRALIVIAQLMHLEVVSQTIELLQVTKDWFDLLSDSDPLKKILAVAKQPFAELHIPGLRVIESLAGLPWGQEYLSSQPGFEEYLIDRRTETTKDGMERKFAIVRTLVDSPTASNIFGNESFLRLRTFVSQGPFYVQTQSLVAVDST